ncbi:hypothetical protein OIV83_005924 [Microbotryomycetes sp. JL201]|nr:hypothetical protein OIV83_005924 [Microbotryomycetes sp. JL201]
MARTSSADFASQHSPDTLKARTRTDVGTFADLTPLRTALPNVLADVSNVVHDPPRLIGQGMAASGAGAQPAQGDSARPPKRTGRCKFFNAQKGFGFILDDHSDELGDDEVFVHYSAIEAVQTGRGGFRSLMEGENVEYHIVRGQKGWQAQGVTGPNGIACIGAPANGGPQASSGNKDARKYASMPNDRDHYGQPLPRRRGHDSGYYSSSALTSPMSTPHQMLYPLPQFPFYPGSPHFAPMGVAPPFPPPFMVPSGYALANGSPPEGSPSSAHLALSPPGSTLQLEDASSPYRPLPPSTFFPAGPNMISAMSPHAHPLVMSPINAPMPLPSGMAGPPQGALGYYPMPPPTRNHNQSGNAMPSPESTGMSPPMFPIALGPSSPTSAPATLDSSSTTAAAATPKYYAYPISGAPYNEERRRRQSTVGDVNGNEHDDVDEPKMPTYDTGIDGSFNDNNDTVVV